MLVYNMPQIANKAIETAMAFMVDTEAKQMKIEAGQREGYFECTSKGNEDHSGGNECLTCAFKETWKQEEIT